MSEITKPIFLDETGQAMVSALQSIALITSGFVGAPGSGVPTGGSAGQILKKKSNTDYDTEWSVVAIDADDVSYNPADTYTNGTVGKAITDTENAAFGAYPVDSVSGVIVDFPDGADNLPLKSFVVGIDLVQSGSGDPSPDNVRPISGWTGAKLYRTGKNLFDQSQLLQAENWTLNSDGYYTGTRRTFHVAFINGLPILPKFKANTQYTLSFIGYTDTDSSGAYFRIVYTDDTFNFIYINNTTPETKVLTSYADKTIKTIIGTYGTDPSAITYLKNMQLEEGTSATNYESFGTTIPISWQSEAGTLYGGTLNVLTGILTKTMGQISSYAGETIAEPWISDRDVYTASTTPTTGAQVVYPLSTPQTYQLTPHEVSTILGLNNIWADTGDVDVTYRADITQQINSLTAASIGAIPAPSSPSTGDVLSYNNGTWTAAALSVPAAATSAPLALGSNSSVGTSLKYAREDHVHPSDVTKMDKMVVVTVSDSGAVSSTLDAGKIYDFTGALTSLSIALNAAAAPAQYQFRFDSGATAPTLSIPNTVTMPIGFEVVANRHYEIDILDGYGLVGVW